MTLVDEIAQMIRVESNKTGAGALAEKIIAKAEPYYIEKGKQMERDNRDKREGEANG